MTKLIFLGSGSAFTVGADNFHSNMVFVSDRDRKLLIDCGSDIRFSLYTAGFSHLDITDIYISHLHTDHAGGLEYVGFTTKFDPACQQPNLYISRDMADDLWTRTLSGGMRSVQGDMLEIENFFKVHPIDGDRRFLWDDTQFHLVKVTHINNGYFVVPTYGLFFETNGVKVFISADTQLRLEELGAFYERADIIFQDCETTPFPSQVHAHYTELLNLPDQIKSKMWLYHYQPGSLPDAQQDNFCGFVKRGQVFDFATSPFSANQMLFL
jgi:ribonuclease BN (tRNA processing enzyme)